MSGVKYHPAAAARFNRDPAHTTWHDEAIWFVRVKRDRVAAQVPDWEALRDAAAAIKQHTLAHLADYLEEFEARAIENGAKVHWAANADDFNRTVLGILEAAQARRIVKSKSMLTEECGLNPFLEARGYEVTDTDLGERIIQFLEQPPSHIVLPAIHLKKSEISDLFHDRLGTEAGNADPNYLADAARQDLRKHMLAADAGITGVNFAVAETGAVVVCTNEGNADLGTALPRIHIACMGIEKLVPRFEDLGVFTRLLARSATGQACTAYTTHFTRPAPGRELHIVLVDNGRSALRAKRAYNNSLRCIRCGACLNTCPVYRRSGGYSYNYTLPGPIGSVLAPHRDLAATASLPYASSLCGSCTDVCPVKINLHEQLLHLRGDVVAAGHAPLDKRVMIRAAAFAFGSAWRFRIAGKLMRLMLKLPKFLINNPLNVWGRHRDLPAPPTTSFRDWYERTHGK